MSQISIRNLTKRFGRLTAVDDLSMEIERGSIHSIVGENGAGKSTVVKCLYGIYSPTAGEFFVLDKPAPIRNPRDAMRYGIGMVHQHFMLVPSMTVYQNVVLGDEPRRGPLFDHRRALDKVRELSIRFGLEIDPAAPVHALPVGLQQRVEILKLLYRNADILIFDEPTAVLSPQEVEGLFSILRSFRDRGKTIIFIAHNLSEVLSISDTISVMRRGRLVATLPRSEADVGGLASLMVGREVTMPRLTEESRPGKEVLKLSSISVTGNRGRPAVRDFSLSVHAGEVVGIAGITGNGQSELEEAIAGLRYIDSGSISLKSIDVSDSPPSRRRDLGLSYIPEDRLKTGLAALGTLKENSLLGFQYQPRFRHGAFQNFSEITGFTRDLLKKYGIAATDENMQAGTLSGGNMQRLVMARELEHDPALLLVSQPTRGVDIGGISYIHEQILRFRSEARAILLLSADLDEILSLSDRIAVIFRGHLVALLPRATASREEIGRYMLEGKEIDR